MNGENIKGERRVNKGKGKNEERREENDGSEYAANSRQNKADI
jgi:hypothetical protein